MGSVLDYNPVRSQIESQKFPDSVSRRFSLDFDRLKISGRKVVI